MKFSDALFDIRNMENAESFSPGKILSILCDYGVFKENPKIRLAVRSALSHNFWDMFFTNSTNESDLHRLTLSLQNDGFSESVIFEVINSLYANNVDNDHNQPNPRIDTQSHPHEQSVGCFDIRFLGLKLGDHIDSFRKILISKRFFSKPVRPYSGLVMMYKEHGGDMSDYESILWEEYEGQFADQDCMSLVLFATPITQKVYRVDVKMRYSGDDSGKYGRKHIFDNYIFFKDLLSEKYGTPNHELYVDISKTVQNNVGRGITYNDGTSKLTLTIESALPRTNYYQTVLRYINIELGLNSLLISEKSQQRLLDEERNKANRNQLLSEI